MPAAAVSSLLASTLALFLVGIGIMLSGILRGSSTLDVPWAAAENAANPGGGGNICGDATTAVPVPDPPGAPSAFGCTDLSPAVGSFLSLDSSALSSSSITAAVQQQRGGRYGAVFEGNFAGIDELYGSVSLRAALAAAGGEEEEAGSPTDGDGGDESLGEGEGGGDVVDVMLEACTEAAAGEWGVCEGGWRPVLFQVCTYL